ncbi:MAG: 16S rRNA (guanine(966)-N(2))-methyltransferase RsmD [Acidiferrobacteraceae bacterium]|jgi:16S rRNA (guanine966-N2)-methyltransferase|nr:16S rRNA (guanine(966)-N(2))-methyltransferase RsmD [Acidiferrobacteraceae bacterium]|tara:strand:- start:56356 stop:56967 length:612 start_codon:yes stop_codon:yes gene_type:complete
MIHRKPQIQKGSLRIIGGVWKSRVIEFSGSKNLRPTADSTRETLFNWLAPEISGSKCLDLFAGSGSLGFEAASRGANEVHMVDNNHITHQQLLHTCKILAAIQINVYCQNALDFLKKSKFGYDIVFLDPPFQNDLLPEIVSILEQSGSMIDNALIYIEQPNKIDRFELQERWSVYREKRSSNIIYGLYRLNKNLKSTHNLQSN